MATANSLKGLGVLNSFDTVANNTTDSVLQAAVTNKTIIVLAIFANCSNATGPATITFNSKPAGAGTAISPAFRIPTGGGFVLPYSPVGWFETNVSEGLTATTGATNSDTAVIVVWKPAGA
jgi:hypothetical protein